MFSSQFKNTISSNSSLLSNETLQIVRHLEVLFEIDLHKKWIKLIHRKLIRAISHFYSRQNSKSIHEKKSKNKIRIFRSRDENKAIELFSSNWAIDHILVTKVLKTLLANIEQFKQSSVFQTFRTSKKISVFDIFSSFNQLNRKRTSSERSQKKINEISTDFSNIVEFFRLSTSLIAVDQKRKFTKTKNISLRNLYIDQEEQSNDSKSSEAQKRDLVESNSFHISSSVDCLHSATFIRVDHARVQSNVSNFQSSQFRDLRELLVVRRNVSSTILVVNQSTTAISSSNIIALKNTLSDEYSNNVSSIIFRHYNYQSLQRLIQRNFDFLESILFKFNVFSVIISQFEIARKSVESFSDLTSRNFSNSTSASLESNWEENLRNDIITQKKISSSVFFTTSLSKNQVYSFFSFSTLFFDSLFHQFRFSFFSEFFTFFVKSMLSSRLSLQHDLEFSRIEKVNDCLTTDISSKLVSSINRVDSDTNITSAMSTFEKNVSLSSVFNLTQQNIQEIILFMFNLFAQNVQNQTQAKAVEATVDVVTKIKKSSFRVSDVRFFDSQLNSFYDSDDVVQINRDLYYKNVYFFVKRVKDAMIMSNAEIVRTNLSICLRETTQVWYTEDLSDLEKKTLRTFDDDADHWCNALLKKFKKFVAFALNYLIIERYTLNDVRANRDISSFVFQIMRHAKVVNIADLHDQLTWVYNAIVSKLIKDINSFDENISIMMFLKNLEIKKNIWHRIYTRKSTSSRIEFEFSSYQINSSNFSYLVYDQSTYTSRQNSQRQFQSTFESVNAQRNFQRFLSNDNIFQKEKASYKFTETIIEKNTQSTNDDQSSTQNMSFEIQSTRNQIISAWKQNVSQKIISEQNQTHLSSNSANTTFTENRTSLERYNNDEREQYQDQEKRDQFRKFYDNREQSMKAYVAKESENQEIANQSQKKAFEDIDSTEENNREDQNDQFVYNLNINSSEICRKCDVKRKTFKFNNAFYSHIRVCKDDETKINILANQKFENVLIVKSSVKNTIKKNYDFRFYQYVIVWMQISLKKSSIKRITNTKCVVFLMNWKYLTTILLNVNIQNMLAFINVRDIKNILHQFNFYAFLNLYLLDIIDDKKIKEHIHREFHIIDELKCKILMKLNIMISE
jgi:hypothetical protein